MHPIEYKYLKEEIESRVDSFVKPAQSGGREDDDFILRLKGGCLSIIIIILIAVTYHFVDLAIKIKHNIQFINTPKIGDLYIINYSKRNYRIYRLKSMDGKNIYLAKGKAQMGPLKYSKECLFNGTISKPGYFYEDQDLKLPKDSLKRLNRKGVIAHIARINTYKANKQKGD